MNDVFKLTPQEWAQLRALLDQALTLPPGDRAAWVDKLADDPHDRLKPRLRRLLAHAEDASADAPATVARLLDTLPKIETAQFAPPPEGHAATPQHIGPYRLLRELGSGGMASVWLAERTDMLQRRQVALKLPHGAWRRAGLAERMAREREILATLEHPHIARLYDAGVGDDGQPYLALEYVEGVRLDAWCESQALDVPARLRLFLQVARAVAHAHAQLVVHRDLKPSNILVTADGQAKLLDFGIAKLLDQGQAEETELTQQSGRALTPDYAAPEQILGQPIGTAADIYALGVVLFELLTGQRPYQLKRDTRAALEEAILQADVPRPSSVADKRLRAALRGDLDTIVLKALKKAPVDRYATVAALAEDLQRHLDHRPVLARPDSAVYRLRTALRRHRVLVAAGTAVALALLAGTAVALWQAQLARQQRDAAVAERERADRQASAAQLARRIAEAQASVSDFLLTDAAQPVPHAQAVAQIEQAVNMVRKQYRDDPVVRGELLADAGNRLRWIGEGERAIALWTEAETLMRESGRYEVVAAVLCMRARERALAGQIDQARQFVADGRLALQRVADPNLRAGAGCILDEAVVERRAGNPLRALALSEQALALERAAGRAETDLVATLLHEVGRARFDLGRYAEAEASARESMDIQERIGRDLGGNRRAAWFLLGMARRDGGLTAQALLDFSGQGQLDHRGKGLSVVNRMHIAMALLAQGRAREALQLLRALEAEASADDRHLLQVHAARAHLALDDLAAADTLLRRADAYFAPLVEQRQILALRYLLAKADSARRRGALTAAAARLDQAEATILAPPQPGDPPALELFQRSLHRARAELALAQRRHPEALVFAQQALALSERTAIDRRASLYIGEDLLLRGRIHLASGSPAAAQRDAQAARAHIVSAGGPAHPQAEQAAQLVRATEVRDSPPKL